MSNVSLSADYEPSALTYISEPVSVGHARSHADGSFDIVVPADSKQPDSITAWVDLPRLPHRPRKGDLGSYGGVLEKVSERRENVVIIRKFYAF